MARKKDFILPEAFLSQLNEFTGGGFCLFFINSEGEPCVIGQADNAVNELGLQQYISLYVRTIEEISEMSMLENIMGSDDEDPSHVDPNDDDDEEPY